MTLLSLLKVNKFTVNQLIFLLILISLILKIHTTCQLIYMINQKNKVRLVKIKNPYLNIIAMVKLINKIHWFEI